MNKNIIQFIINENGSFLNIPVGNIKAKSNLTTRLQVVTPISASTAVNYLIYDSKNIEKKQYLIPKGELGSEVVDPNNPLYSQVASWKVYEADIYAPILSVISKYRTGRVGVSFEFTQQTPNALCTNFVDYFGFDKPLPEIANSGDYYICENYNFWFNDKLYNKGDILVWYGEQWNNGGILPKGLTETIDISVDPAISYPAEEIDETAFGNAIGALSDEVADLIAITSSFNGVLNGKQDKVDLSLETNAKTVVGGINELKTDKQDKTDNSLQTNSKQVVGAINENKTNIENNYNVLNNNKLDKNFNLLVERTYAQLADFVAVRSGDQTLKMTLQTLRTYLTQDLVRLRFNVVEVLPATGFGNIIYLTPLVDNIIHIDTFANLPEVGEAKTLYVVDDEYSGGTSGWYIWDGGSYSAYSNGFYEYAWIEELGKYELIGSIQVDLTGYATETWVTDNFVAKTILNGGTTGQILAKKSDNDLDFEFVDKPQAPIQEIQLNGVEVPPVDGVVDLKVIASLDGVEMILDTDKTYLKVKISVDNDEFTLLTGTTGSPNYTIEWGDGSSEDVVGTSNPTHTYEKAGMYLITISGSFTNGIVVGNDANVNKDKMIEVYGGNNYPTSIGQYAFLGCTNLTIATLPNAISIGEAAFFGCSNLTTATFPSITSIGEIAFFGCTSLTTVTLPKATSIGEYAFDGCTSLTTATFPNVASIGNDAFRNCSNLTTATLPSITSIAGYAFYDCTNLTTATLPKATSIGEYAFLGCTSLKDLTLGNVTTTATGDRFTSVKLDTLTISGTITDTDITRIKTLIISNGGSFSQSYEIKYGLQIEKTPTLDNDVVRKIDLDLAIQTAIYDSWGGEY